MVFLDNTFYKHVKNDYETYFTFILLYFCSKRISIIIKDSIRDVLIDDYENIYVYHAIAI